MAMEPVGLSMRTPRLERALQRASWSLPRRPRRLGCRAGAQASPKPSDGPESRTGCGRQRGVGPHFKPAACTRPWSRPGWPTSRGPSPPAPAAPASASTSARLASTTAGLPRHRPQTTPAVLSAITSPAVNPTNAEQASADQQVQNNFRNLHFNTFFEDPLKKQVQIIYFLYHTFFYNKNAIHRRGITLNWFLWNILFKDWSL